MPEGDKVLLLLGSGNRDERVWDRADVFDIDRTWPTHHLAFGHGIHVCLGAALRAARDAREPRGVARAVTRATRSTRRDSSACTPATYAGYSRMPIRL